MIYSMELHGNFMIIPLQSGLLKEHTFPEDFHGYFHTIL